MADFVLVCEQETIPNQGESCTGVTSWIDIQSINPLTELDLEVFGLVNGTILISFLVGHVTGRLVKWLGK